jgi:hypothetical protein
MNKLSTAERAKVLHLLCEGNSIRAITRLLNVGKNTVVRLMLDAGEACATYHDEHVRELKSKRIQCDEIWSFVAAKQKNVAAMKSNVQGAGDIWTWTALDADTTRDCMLSKGFTEVGGCWDAGWQMASCYKAPTLEERFGLK